MRNRDGVFSVREPPNTYLFQDAFTAANGTNLTANGWSAESGTWTVDTNRAKSSLAGGICVYETGVANVYIRCTLNCTAGGTMGLSARYTDLNNNWLLGIEPGFGGIVIYERSAGVLTLRTSVAAALSNGVDYIGTAILTGTSIRWAIAGFGEATYTSASHQSSTKHGLRCGLGGANDRWNDFCVGRMG